MVAFLSGLVNRTVFSIVISLVLLLLGVQAFFTLTTREFPKTTFSTITITTPYPGADSALVKGFITTPLEQTISTANGIDYIQSVSVQGASTISARLELNYDPQSAVAEILTKINQVSNELPPQAENPQVTIQTGDSNSAIYIGFQSNSITRAELTDYVDRSVRPRLESVPGVQDAPPLGSTELALRVWLDPVRMAALNVTASDIRQTLTTANIVSAVGETRGSVSSLSLSADTNVNDLTDFENLIVRQDGERLVRLSDVAEIKLGSQNYDTNVLLNGDPVVNVGVNLAPDANLLDVVAGVREIYPEIEASLPGDITSKIVYDSSIAVQKSINSVIVSLVMALGIVTAIIYLFLGRIRSVIIPVITMPLALVGAFFFMQLFGFTINLLTLLALILAIGTIVDDSIIITENAVRHVSEGDSPEDAAKKTVKELSRSIIAMNIVVVAAFIPVGLAGGLTGTLFKEFAYVVAAATVCSGIAALTLSPMMCRVILKADQDDKNKITQWLDNLFNTMREGYMKMLDRAFDWSKGILVAALVIVGSVYFFYTGAQSELAPNEDQGFMQVILNGNPNASLDRTEAWTKTLTDQLDQYQVIEDWFAFNGSGDLGTDAMVGIVLKPWGDRDKAVRDLQPELTGTASSVVGFQSIVIIPDTLPGATGGAPIQFVVSSIDDPQNIYETAQKIVEEGRKTGLYTYINSDLKFDRGQVNLEIDRERAAAIGVDIDQLAADLSVMVSSNYTNFFSYDERSYRVIPQVLRNARLQPSDLGQYYVRAGDGELVPMSSVVTFNEVTEPRSLSRFNQLNAAIISAVPAPGAAYGEAIAFLQNQTLPSNYVTDWIGQSRQFTSEGSTLIVTFILAVFIIYLTLSAQYESFRDPAVMFICVPMALAGALIFFYFGVVTVNIYTQIGLLALISIIIRHGILLVEFANNMQEDGMDRREAMRKAAEVRFRSIIMTTISTVTGMLPLIFASSGPGVQSRFAISFTLVSGMMIGTIFTLFVVPSLYTLLAKKRGNTENEKSEQKTSDADYNAEPATS